MKILLEDNKGVSITATGLSDELIQDEIANITIAMLDMIEMIHRHKNNSNKNNIVMQQKEPTKEEMQAIEEVIKQSVSNTISSGVSLIRPRIPNNIVDIRDLNIKQAITEKALVRCPHCGQAHCLTVNSGDNIYVMERDFVKNEFNVIAEFDSLNSNEFIGMCCKSDTDRLAYFNDLQNIQAINKNDFTANNDTEIFCPVCCTSNDFLQWKKAFENPLEYFETEHLCDICGGEKLEKIIREEKKYVCESCGYETKYKEK